MVTSSNIFLVEKKWNLYILNNNIEKQYLPENKFLALLRKNFNEDKYMNILNYLNNNDKLIIDFNNSIVKLIKYKDIDYIQALGCFFDPNYVEQSILEGDDLDILYNKED